jgi:hypothetical protein
VHLQRVKDPTQGVNVEPAVDAPSYITIAKVKITGPINGGK